MLTPSLGATPSITAITDNAALTYLGSLVPGLSAEFKVALVAGAVTGGGLTVIANAPNPQASPSCVLISRTRPSIRWACCLRRCRHPGGSLRLQAALTHRSHSKRRRQNPWCLRRG